jgi:predicted CxxxxCH...CXXCH cytochrome family protein
MGWLTRLGGLSIDNLASAEVVTAGGLVLRASADEHADLFWAIRGGGGNFGVVTEFEFRLHEVGPIVHLGFLFWGLEQRRGAFWECPKNRCHSKGVRAVRPVDRSAQWTGPPDAPGQRPRSAAGRAFRGHRPPSIPPSTPPRPLPVVPAC